MSYDDPSREGMTVDEPGPAAKVEIPPLEWVRFECAVEVPIGFDHNALNDSLRKSVSKTGYAKGVWAVKNTTIYPLPDGPDA